MSETTIKYISSRIAIGYSAVPCPKGHGACYKESDTEECIEWPTTTISEWEYE